MSPAGISFLGIVSALLLAVVVGVLVLAGPFRAGETRAAASLARSAGADAAVEDHAKVRFSPAGKPAFTATVNTPSSALPSLLVLTALSLLLPMTSWPRSAAVLLGVLAAITAINIARLGAAMLIGSRVGDSSLILFHDWVGAAFSFIYTLTGFLLILFGRLPSAGGAVPRSVA
jgi:exosortase/archaeosortase family protein